MDDFWYWWQHLPENIDPVLFQIGSFRLQYYGLMYIVAFVIVFSLTRYRLKDEKRFEISISHLINIMLYMFLGLLIGARLGYVVFYNLPYYLRHPLEIFVPFSFLDGVAFVGISGVSYHGGLIGVIVAGWLYVRKNKLNPWDVIDLCFPAAPLGYTFGRLGNFINGELYGRVTAAKIGMYFPMSPTKELRHPSQLYEAFFEGIFLFLVLWNVRKIKLPKGAMIALYLVGYGLVRFIIEFFREPDTHLGFVFLSLSMGQLLCALMIVIGVLLYAYLWRKEKTSL
ncbi:MAG TPA: prolipoprotein diacylglyceryl transferase [Deltaproteobacteria bacterium]|nr:prolipoprotein diacylglyceryl transferase [Deltaproteobacteria bacterium]